MKTSLLPLILLLGAASLATAWQAEAPTQTKPSPEHAWLLQFVGDWDASFEAAAEPGTEPATWEGEESVRAIGELWMVAEGSMDVDGETFSTMFTVGYDSAEEAFVGSWVDSVQSRMWTYRGSLDNERRVLTLATEGPSITTPGERANYRDLLEHIDDDTKRITSLIQDKDGEWVQYMTVSYRRRK